MDERFFYHSFPRRGASTAEEIDKGCKILNGDPRFRSVVNATLIEWNQPSLGGTPPRVFPVIQKRVCFTELGPLELPQHAEKFGHFALEFEIDAVRRLGAVPVFYVPQPTGEAAVDGSAVGTALLAIAMDSHVVIQRMACLDQLFKGQRQWQSILIGSRGLPAVLMEGGTTDLIVMKQEFSRRDWPCCWTPWDNLRDGAFALLNFFHPTDNVKQDKT